MTDGPIEIDYCPIHESTFSKSDRIDCHYRISVMVDDWASPKNLKRCEWWAGTLTDLRPVRSQQENGE